MTTADAQSVSTSSPSSLPPAEPVAPLAEPGAAVKQVQVLGDLFCRCCGYNLYGLAIRVLLDNGGVTRSAYGECTCPACKTVNVLAHNRDLHPLVQRLAWMPPLIYLGGVTLLYLILAAVGIAGMKWYEMMLYQRDSYYGLLFEWFFALLWLVLAGFFSGVCMATLSWFYRRWQHFWWLLWVPALVLYRLLDEQLDWGRQLRDSQTPIHIWVPSLFMVASLALGLWCGRPLTRGLLSLLLPVGMRSRFAFLWRSDGLSPPGAPKPASGLLGVPPKVATADTPSAPETPT